MALQVSSLVLPSLCASEPVPLHLFSPLALRASLPAADSHLTLKKALNHAQSRYILGGFLSHLVPPHSCITSLLVPQLPFQVSFSFSS